MKKNKLVYEIEEKDPFFDDYGQEIFVCCDIIDKCKMIADNKVTITLDKEFLQKMLTSHIHHIRNL
jgi:regulator of RNase E activity RraB